jgi:hypothetical protein|tara:strand:- start:420 stop:668 length:249 start_codon:yes stop_codon:yes gene_type:complete
MLSAKCKVCNKELTSTNKVQCCGCPNQMMVVEDKVGAKDLSKVLLTNSEKNIKNNRILTDADLKYQEARRQRKVRKLNYEER